MVRRTSVLADFDKDIAYFSIELSYEFSLLKHVGTGRSRREAMNFCMNLCQV